MKFQTCAILLAAASSEAFSPLSNNIRTNVALREGLSVDLPSVESQVSDPVDTLDRSTWGETC